MHLLRLTNLLLLISFLGILASRAAPIAVSTPSGRPEVFIPGRNSDQVKAVIVDRELGKGWQLLQDDPYQLSFRKAANTFGAIISFGSQFNGIPDTRSRFTMTEEEGGTRLFLNGEIVSNPGSGFERVYPIEDADRKAFPVMQKVLEQIKADCLAHARTSPAN